MRAHLLLVGAVALSWLGLFIHNLADLPAQTILSPETLYPTVVYLLLVAVWFVLPGRIAAWLGAVWVLLQLIGGAIISVLPLPMLPFHPEQTLHHFAFHAIYGALQVPLLIFVVRGAKGMAGRGARVGSEANGHPVRPVP